MSLIGISGGISEGKDTVAKAIRFLTSDARHSLSFEKFLAADLDGRSWKTDWRVNRFAAKLKKTVALYIGCAVEQLEDQTFKNTILGPEWDKWEVSVQFVHNDSRHIQTLILDKVFATQNEAVDYAESQENYQFNPHVGMFDNYMGYSVSRLQMTPRLFLQLLGTEGMRDVIHPNVHVNGLFADYKKEPYGNTGQPDFDWAHRPDQIPAPEYPNWLIPDTRFPNEADAILNRDGLLFKVVNPRIVSTSKHESERALRDYKNFNDIIINDGSLEELVKKVDKILSDHNII